MNRCAVSITIRTTGSLANSSSKTIMVDLVVRGIILHIGPQFTCIRDLLAFVKAPPDVSPEIQGTLTLLLAEGQSGCVHSGSLEVSLCADSTESLGDVIAGLGQISLTEQKSEVELDYDHTEEPSQSQEDLQASLLKSAIQDTRFRKPLLPFELGEDLVHEDYPSDADFVQANSARTGLKTKLTDSHLPSIIRNYILMKFLTELRPNDGGNLRSTGSPMLRVKFDLVDSPDEDGKQEAILKLKIVPLRLYVDQDAVDFLKTYFGFQKENRQLDKSSIEKKTKEGF
ncbi:uncharacterized protein MELLADRAFT_114138 [Melampsora larici-populina 98AG31]|uniref:Autophagy-related protein 2 n=1 Tax=Melampsora larici-populina (strain 98AG31 / pathotype 3-4-7) TaxID=747676 RepID=F4SCA6_MELLP|nr:uncharacterized protein MELLADRAFT_114138 [Melampsora larici-populina 98AG31]EGF97720.1 hypothetical protein MELLADRAFT_114138 [Melampsora larici-populina 98AG31]